MTAMVSIAPSYPDISPTFCLALQLDGETETLETSEMVRDLEREVNLGWGEQAGDKEGNMLLVMLHRLLVLLDVVLEVRSSMQEGEGGPKRSHSLIYAPRRPNSKLAVTRGT